MSDPLRAEILRMLRDSLAHDVESVHLDAPGEYAPEGWLDLVDADPDHVPLLMFLTVEGKKYYYIQPGLPMAAYQADLTGTVAAQALIARMGVQRFKESLGGAPQ